MKRILLVVALLLFTGCSNVKDLKFTGKNNEEIMEKIKKSKDLTGEESALFMQAIMRSAFSNSTLEGKRVGDLITEQKKINDEVEAKEKAAKQLAEEAARKEAALAIELQKYLVVSPYNKTFHKADVMSGDFEDRINLQFVFENKGDKDIRAFKGVCKFKDLFGEIIHEAPMTYDDGVKIGAKVNWAGSLKFNQFISSHTKFRDTELQNMKFEWVPKAIIFSDGSKLGGSET